MPIATTTEVSGHFHLVQRQHIRNLVTLFLVNHTFIFYLLGLSEFKLVRFRFRVGPAPAQESDLMGLQGATVQGLGV